jgi:hypothetical protein
MAKMSAHTDQAARSALRDVLLAARPEWDGRIWIYKQSVTVRGIGNVWLRCDELSAKDADNVLSIFDELVALTS